MARTVAFPVSAALPSAGASLSILQEYNYLSENKKSGGGVFRAVPSTPSTMGSRKITTARNSAAKTAIFQENRNSKLHSGALKAVFVRTSRDACDGTVWNSGVLHEDVKIVQARREIERQRENEKTDAREINLKNERVRLEKIYRKQFLLDGTNGWDYSAGELLDRGSSASRCSFERVRLVNRSVERNRMETMENRKVKYYQQQIQNHPTDNGTIMLCSSNSIFLGGIKSSEFATSNETSTTSSAELLSSLTMRGTNTEKSDSLEKNFAEKQRTAQVFGNGIPPVLPESPRAWKTVKAVLQENSRRRSSWADLNRNNEYMYKYD
ncbi:hypothetical protein HK100_003171, partial [Physocladia obscura]